MLAANFQSFKASLVVLSVPAALFWVTHCLLVKITGATLNLQIVHGHDYEAPGIHIKRGVAYN